MLKAELTEGVPFLELLLLTETHVLVEVTTVVKDILSVHGTVRKGGSYDAHLH